MHRMLAAFFGPTGPGNEQILKAQYGQSKPGLSLIVIRGFLAPVPTAEELDEINDVIQRLDSTRCTLQEHALRTLELRSRLTNALLAPGPSTSCTPSVRAS